MADEIINEILFQKGFNHAYYLEKDEKGKDYLKEIQAKNNSLSYAQGLEKGKQEAQREQFIQQSKAMSEKSKDRER